MNDLIIVGASGFGREVAWLVERINRVTPTWNLLGFMDDLLHTAKRFQSEYLQVVAFVRQTVDAVPDKQLHRKRNGCVYPTCQKTLIFEHSSHLQCSFAMLLCSAFRRLTLCGHHDRIIRSWH